MGSGVSDEDSVVHDREGRWRHPLATALIYLSEGGIGGPTIVLNQTRQAGTAFALCVSTAFAAKTLPFRARKPAFSCGLTPGDATHLRCGALQV